MTSPELPTSWLVSPIPGDTFHVLKSEWVLYLDDSRIVEFIHNGQPAIMKVIAELREMYQIEVLWDERATP